MRSTINSIRWRITLPVVLLFLAAMGGLGIYLSNFIQETYQADLESKLAAEASLIADGLSEENFLSGSGIDPNSRVQRWSELLDARVTLIDAGGRVTGESHEDRALMENHLDRQEMQEALLTGIGSSIRFSETLGVDMMYVAVPVEGDGEILGFARVALPLSRVQTNLGHIRQVLVRVTLIFSLLTVLVTLWITGRTTAPLRKLTQAARQLAAGRMEHVIIEAKDSEVEQLTHAFNDMAFQLNDQIQRLKAESSKLSTVLQQMTDGVVLVDGDGRVRLINPAAERIFKVTNTEALARSATEVLKHYQFVDLWQQSLKTGQSQQITVDLLRPKMSLRGVATPMGENMPGSTLLVFQDLSRIRLLETVRRDFLSNISHELRTPLASLKALTETLKESALDDPPAAKHFLESMDKELDALTHTVAELLELTRIESGQVPLQLRPVPPGVLINSSSQRMMAQAERAELELTVDYPPGLPDVKADPVRMEQVLVNLLHNAIKFTPPGGKVVISAQRQAEEVVISVQDTGVGIPSEDLPRIFERFYKTDKARSKDGTGLGLAIAKHLVEAHGGRIWVESVEGQGSSFCISLHAAEK